MAPIFMSPSDLRALDSRRVSEMCGGSVAGVVFVAKPNGTTKVRVLYVDFQERRYSRLNLNQGGRWQGKPRLDLANSSAESDCTSCNATTTERVADSVVSDDGGQDHTVVGLV
jgi:hypothetical protein